MRLLMMEELAAGMRLAQDVFLSDESASPFVRKNVELNARVIRRMKSMGVPSVYILEEGEEAPPDAPRSPPALEPELRDGALESLENTFTAMQKLELDPSHVHEATRQAVQQMDFVVGRMVRSLMREELVLVSINDLKSYDDYTYHHSLSVAVLSLAMGRGLGFDENELHRLGLTAMMHDIGKIRVPVELIQKPGRLNDDEFGKVRGHSQHGYEMLVESDVGTDEMRYAVQSHHERMDGKGYPQGLKGYEIPLHSRLISVADVYDALTSHRPYRRPMQPLDALEYIMGCVGSAFDYDMVLALMKNLDPYPVGSLVELSDGRIAEVLNNEHQTRPVLQLVDSDIQLDLFRDRSCLSLVIRRLVTENGLTKNDDEIA